MRREVGSSTMLWRIKRHMQHMHIISGTPTTTHMHNLLRYGSLASLQSRHFSM